MVDSWSGEIIKALLSLPEVPYRKPSALWFGLAFLLKTIISKIEILPMAAPIVGSGPEVILSPAQNFLVSAKREKEVTNCLGSDISVQMDKWVSQIKSAQKKPVGKLKITMEQYTEFLDFLHDAEKRLACLDDSSPSQFSEVQNGPLRQLFISYSHVDSSFVAKLSHDLQKAGIEVWFDTKEIRVGDSITMKVEEGISKFEFF